MELDKEYSQIVFTTVLNFVLYFFDKENNYTSCMATHTHDRDTSLYKQQRQLELQEVQ